MAISLAHPGTATTAAQEPGRAAPEAHGYLDEAAVARLALAVPPPPPTGSQRARDDQAESLGLRTLEETERWLLATAHAEVRPPLGLQHFDCALGVRLAGAEAPRLQRLMTSLFHDADAVAERVKARAHRPRPVADDPRRRPCQRVSEQARATPSYPSGTAAVGAAYAEAFAALAPDRAEAVRVIGHEIGLSRQICGMHYPSDVQAGEAVGRAVVAEAAKSPHFHHDIEAARRELAALQALGLANPGCAAERSALAARRP